MSIGGAFNIIGIGPQGLYKSKAGGGAPVIDTQALQHYLRVTADGGVVPSGLNGVNNFFTSIKSIYATADITTAISAAYDAQYLGYKLGAGSGTALGQAAQKLYSCSGASGDVVQTTAANQPLLLAHEGSNYWFGSGVDGNFVSTPNRTPAGSTQLDVKVKFEGGNLSANRTFFSQSSEGGGETDIFILRFQNATTGTINMLFGAGLALSQTSSVGIGVINNYMGWIRVTYLTNGVTANVTFFSSIDGINYTQLSTHTVASPRLGNQNAPYQIGSNIGFNPFQGKISRATASNSIGGAPVVDFNPQLYNAATSQTQWTSTTGEVWSIKTGTAATGYKGVLVDRTEVQGDAISTFIVSSTIPSQQYYTSFVVGSLFTNPNTAPRFLSGNGDSHLIFKTGAAAFEAFNGLQMAFTGESINTLLVWIVNYNSTSSKTWINNANETNGSTGTLTSNRISLFGGVTGLTLSNSLINTVIRPTGISTNTQRTDLFNYLKSINNL